MLDLGSKSFIIPPEAAKAYQIAVVKITISARASNMGGTTINTEGLFTMHLGMSLANHRTYDNNIHAFEVMQTSPEYDAFTPAWYLNKHQTQGIMEGHMHFPFCSEKRFRHGKLHP